MWVLRHFLSVRGDVCTPALHGCSAHVGLPHRAHPSMPGSGSGPPAWPPASGPGFNPGLVPVASDSTSAEPFQNAPWSGKVDETNVPRIRRGSVQTPLGLVSVGVNPKSREEPVPSLGVPRGPAPPARSCQA